MNPTPSVLIKVQRRFHGSTRKKSDSTRKGPEFDLSLTNKEADLRSILINKQYGNNALVDRLLTKVVNKGQWSSGMILA